MSDLSYVRTEMLEQKAPPASSVGLVGWLRANLFSSVGNSILTVVTLFFLLSLLASMMPWIFLGIWNADSLSHCREIFAERYGDSTEYACWAVVRDRWDQIIFGYSFGNLNEGLYWRPLVGLALIILALLPILYPNVPRVLYVATAASLFLYPWLIWGGSIWGPLTIALCIIAGVFIYRFASRFMIMAFAMPVAIVGTALLIYFAMAPVAGALGSAVPIELQSVPSREISGFVLSITIGIVAIVASLPIAVLLALGRQSDLFIVNKLSTGFIEIIRGVPLITLIFVATVLMKYFLPSSVDLDPVLAVMVLVTLFTAAYIAEVIRGGLAALPKGQYEAADALGLTYWQAQRLIILPQALKISIPGIVSNFISVFKDTTLVSIVALNDPLGISDSIRSDSDWNGIVWELYGFIAIVFWLFCFSMSRYSLWLERQLQTGHR
ncbi:amino acid ABC transporter permease [Cognatishimia activa]|uniref:Inner membrane amino-acid ABC transporter permease protein YhdY n=1 Tax=Cognatishimia activa TaxID=1715691 RepID=A0A0P1IMG9_9RHOB|nr:amino acid ABC transporter permease [Cognatishimia activa]CUI31308.1 Inner membrane amino-acid ABC transporter permease protein YhdY [Cognatishimia activa]CUK24837.1 Inner membrane amino-acid ABC transporter permease protein YhdY [Cognatishimia activa]